MFLSLKATPVSSNSKIKAQFRAIQTQIRALENMISFRGESNEYHFILVPLPAQGHLIPMIDIGCLLAERGVHVSVVITRANADRIKPVSERAKEMNLSIEFIELSFPHAKFGLPAGCESIEHVPKSELFRPFFDALYSLDEPLEDFIRSLQRPPDCIISDMCNAWTAPVARKFSIPRVLFHGPSCFYISTDYNLAHHKVYDSVTDDNEYVTVPDFPIKLQVTKAQAPGFLNSPRFKDMRNKCLEEELSADGVVINTFVELEQPFLENYVKVIGKRVWSIGPICLYNKDIESKNSRGNKEAIDKTHRVLSWLDERDRASVLYINFGSVAYTSPLQLMEIGSALEALNVPFILVIKEKELTHNVEKWLYEEGFEERTKDKGLIIVGWAPQMVILSHRAVGSFMTHCGWNSILEAISMGVLMITWPRVADQFVNEKLVVDVLKIGFSLGVKVPSAYTMEEDVSMVKSNDIRKAVVLALMDGVEANGRKERIKDFSEKAKKAMEEGGSSYRNLTDFISYFTRA